MTAHADTQGTNRRVVLASRPVGAPSAENFDIENVAAEKPGPEQVALETLYLSIDPYMRGRLSEAPSYDPPVPIGGVIVGGTVSRVTASNSEKFASGDLVVARSGWQTHAVADADTVRAIPRTGLSDSTALGVLGMPGFTAYAGLLNIGKPSAGETVVVAAATGPVGSAVGQIARIKGARAVGIVGGEAKRRYALTELGFDAVIDHRAPDFAAQLAAACPSGIDVYFESVGGAVFDAVLPLLNRSARIPLCGLVSEYNIVEREDAGPDRLPWFMNELMRKSITVRGFLQREFIDTDFDKFLHDVPEWIHSGEFKFCEDITTGLENAPEALRRMLVGENFGKVVVKISE